MRGALNLPPANSTWKHVVRSRKSRLGWQEATVADDYQCAFSAGGRLSGFGAAWRGA
jgi:hypothetical protein